MSDNSSPRVFVLKDRSYDEVQSAKRESREAKDSSEKARTVTRLKPGELKDILRRQGRTLSEFASGLRVTRRNLYHYKLHTYGVPGDVVQQMLANLGAEYKFDDVFETIRRPEPKRIDSESTVTVIGKTRKQHPDHQ